MLNFKEFLTEGEDLHEATIADVKTAARSGKYSYKDTSDESRFQFARDMKAEGFRGNEVSNAWKSMVVSGEILQLKATNPPKPVVPKAPPLTDTEVKALDKAWDDVMTAYNVASELSAKLRAKVVASVEPGTQVHIKNTPDLYAVLKGLEMSSPSKDFSARIKQVTGFAKDAGRHYKGIK